MIFFDGQTPDIQVAGHSFPAKNFMPCFYTFSGVLIMATGYLINRIVARKTHPQQQR